MKILLHQAVTCQVLPGKDRPMLKPILQVGRRPFSLQERNAEYYKAVEYTEVEHTLVRDSPSLPAPSFTSVVSDRGLENMPTNSMMTGEIAPRE